MTQNQSGLPIPQATTTTQARTLLSSEIIAQLKATEEDPITVARRVKVAGPPGTGKTTWIVNHIEKLIGQGLEDPADPGTRYAVSPDQITVLSFTRAAATEVSRRLAALPGCGGVKAGTIHSTAIQELAAGGMRIDLARNGRNLKAWNEGPAKLNALAEEGTQELRHFAEEDADGPLVTAAERPDWKLSPQSSEEEGKNEPGDALLSRIDRQRSRLIPRENWEHEITMEVLRDRGQRESDPRALAQAKEEAERCIELAEAWQRFKEACSLMDMQDVIEAAICNTNRSGQVLIIDEAQDCSIAEQQLVHAWEIGHVQTCYVGDDDQTIYQGLKGNDPADFAHMPAGTEVQLETSWRVPSEILRPAVMLIEETIPAHRRWQKEIRPSRRGGSLEGSEASWRQPEKLIPELLKHAERGRPQRQQHSPADTGQVMVLAYARHMLDPLLKMLREEGIPFHNPGANNGAWNPLPTFDTPGRMGVRQRLMALQRLGDDPSRWSRGDLLAGIELLGATGVTKRGKMNSLKALLSGEQEGSKEVATGDVGGARPLFEEPLPEDTRAEEWSVMTLNDEEYAALYANEPEDLSWLDEVEAAQREAEAAGALGKAPAKRGSGIHAPQAKAASKPPSKPQEQIVERPAPAPPTAEATGTEEAQAGGEITVMISAFGEEPTPCLVDTRRANEIEAGGSAEKGATDAETDDREPAPRLTGSAARQALSTEMLDLLEPEAIEAIGKMDADWLDAHVATAKRTGAWTYAIRLLRLGRLDWTPRIIPGTFHSAKGCEAEHVIMFPDLPEARPDLDEENARVLYVGMSRAARRLTICQDVKGTPGGQLRMILRRSMKIGIQERKRNLN